MVLLCKWVLTTALIHATLCASYLSIPLSLNIDKQHNTALLIQVEVNRYPYHLEVSLESGPDQIIDLTQMSLRKAMVNRPDFRKTGNSVFGIIEFQATQKADSRLSTFQQRIINFYHYLTNLPPAITWVNLNQAEQILYKDRRSGTEGTISFGPSSRSPVLMNLKQYSGFM